MKTEIVETDVLAHINGLSSAEDIFAYLCLAYEADVLNVSRLHIMKRFGAYLRDTDFSGLDQVDVRLRCRETLERAYLDFVESTPLQEKVFKVFRDEEEKLKARFVDLDSLTVTAK